MNEPLKSRREREKQARYDAILNAAELVFSEKGYERTSMDDIARTASLSRALLYVYFKDKAAIQRGIMLRAGQSLVTRFENALGSAETGLAQIRAMGEAYYRFYLKNRIISRRSPRRLPPSPMPTKSRPGKCSAPRTS